MDDGDETGSSTEYSTGIGSDISSNEDDRSSRDSSRNRFDVVPEMIDRRISHKNSQSEKETNHGSSSIGSFKIDDDVHHSACKGNKTRFPIIKMASSSSESSLESDASSDFDFETHNPVFKGKPAANIAPTTQFPPIQVMQRSEGYEPDRIPSSVFQRNTDDAHISDWSVASNESLFSIHVGNSHSLTREQAAMIINSQHAQQELFSFTPPRSEQESPSSPTAFPASSPADEPREEEGDEEGEETTSTPSDGHERDPEKVPTVSWKSSSKYSEKSQNSSQSVAFPITKPSKTTVNVDDDDDDDDDDGDENNNDDKEGQPIISKEKESHCWQCSMCCCCNISCCSWPSSCSCCCSWPSCSWSCFSRKPCRSYCCSFRYCLRPSCCFCSDANISFNCWSCTKKSWCCLPTCSSCSSSNEARLDPDMKEGSCHETATQRNTKRRWYSFLCCSWKRLWCCSWPSCGCFRCC